MEKPSILDRINDWARRSVTLKLFSVAILILLLLIPATMLKSLISERQYIHDDATREVSSKWGGEQTIGGPVLTIPYSEPVKDANGVVTYVTSYAHFLPDELNITGTVKPEKRYRGIYVVMLYNTNLHVTGKFGMPDLKALDIPESSCHFEDAFISVGIPDLRGVNDAVPFVINDSTYNFGPGIPVHDVFASGISFKYPLKTEKEYRFSFDLNLNGSTSLNMLPFGKETDVSLTSSWGSPSFEGSFLPDQRTINDSGFTAHWKVLQLNRNYPQQGTGAFIAGSGMDGGDGSYSDNDSSSFGVRLLIPVDEYDKTSRSVKYCLMFIIITFLTFFFVEVLNKKRIHPIQYLLVGFGICLFYVLLLSISEHISFGYAYLVSCAGTLLLITFYVKYIFKNNFLTGIFAALLALLYGFFYSLLQLEDYALLMGSIGLFIILATIMYLTRKVDWYGEKEE